MKRVMREVLPTEIKSMVVSRDRWVCRGEGMLRDVVGITGLLAQEDQLELLERVGVGAYALGHGWER